MNHADAIAFWRHPHTVGDCVRLMGVTKNTAHYHLEQLKQRYPVYITGWRRDTQYGRMTAVYKLGKGKDVPRPKPKYPYPRTKKEAAPAAPAAEWKGW